MSEVERQAHALYGAAALANVPGVLHVVSAVHVGDRLHVIKIGPGAPKSSTDFFVLNFWRAHADAILTTAQIVRAEPALSHALQGPCAGELEQFRSRTLQKTEPPLCAIMTNSGALPLDHRLWKDHVKHRVLTPASREADLRASLQSRAEVVGLPSLDAKRAVQWLRDQGGSSILIEAGPSTANHFYEPPSAVDHLLLSRCEAEPAAAAIGGALSERLFDGFHRLASTPRDEASGRWHFEWYTRKAS